MRKRIAVLLAGAILATLCGCVHQHNWSEATCTSPRKCLECGETEGEPLGHSWSEATCIKAKTCMACGTIEGVPLGHDWIEATYTTPMTCKRCAVTEGEPLLYPVPSSFYEDHEFATFEKFNSPASENGLGGTRVWLQGTYENLITLDLPDVRAGLQAFVALLTDNGGNIWAIQIDINAYNPIEKYEALCNHHLFVQAMYRGYAELYKAPSLLVERIYDRTTGNVIVPQLFIYADDE